MELIPAHAILHAKIMKLLEPMTDAQRLDAVLLTDEWKAGKDYVSGDSENGYCRAGTRLYKCRQSHTSQEGWEPEKTPALWEEITLEPGTHDNPIHYNPGMALEKDLYYTEDGTLYICIRDTGIPVYNFLSELIGIYVEVSE